MNLRGRRVMFIGIGFYDYERSIVERMRSHGAHVDAHTDRPRPLRTSPWSGLLAHLPAVAGGLQRRHEARMLRQSKAQRYDQVLVIKGVDLGVDFLRALRQAQPQAEFILYEWDSLARLPGVFDRLPLFDRVLSFDRQDSAQHPQLQFRPLFFRDTAPAQPGANDADAGIDITFVGWLHSDRLAAVRQFQRDAQAQGLSTFVYLYTGLFTWLRLALAGHARDVHFRPLAYTRLVAIVARTKAVLDLPHALQTGLTMRTIEAVGLGRKLITTGLDIAHYDFYSEANVRIVGGEAWSVDRDFVTRPALPVAPEIVNRYTLDAWLADVLDAPASPP